MAAVPLGERKAEGTTGLMLPALPGAVWERPRLDPGEVTQTSIPDFLRTSVDTSPVHHWGAWRVGESCTISVKTKSLVPVNVTEAFVSSTWLAWCS